jgi:hypothetical protein
MASVDARQHAMVEPETERTACYGVTMTKETPS